MTRQPFTRRQHRWLTLALLLGIIAGWWLLDRWLHPRLTPVTVRLFRDARFVYSANGTGYPAIVSEPDADYLGEARKFAFLDDRGHDRRVMARGDMTAVSPTRQVLAWYDFYGSNGHTIARIWKDGRLTRFSAVSDSSVQPAHVTDNGLTYAFSRHNLPRFQTAAGSPLKLAMPAAGWETAEDIESLDADLLPLCRDGDSNLYAYDLVNKRFAAKFLGFSSMYEGSNFCRYAASIMLRNGTHVAAIPYMGNAMIWDGNTVTKLPVGYSSMWYWGEDGTVWT